jgi:hypothetical protein
MDFSAKVRLRHRRPNISANYYPVIICHLFNQLSSHFGNFDPLLCILVSLRQEAKKPQKVQILKLGKFKQILNLF